MRVFAVLAMLAFGLCAVPAAAQSTDASAVPMTGTFTVYVLDRSGEETEGRLVSLTDAAVAIQSTAGPRTFPLGDVVRIYRKGDSLKNGALIGAGFGLALGFLTGGIADCPGADRSGGCPGARVAFILLGTATYAAIGTAIDALIHGRTLIWRPQGSASSSGGLRFIVSPHTRSAYVGWTIR